MELEALQFFKNLSDETRFRILVLLREMGELCVYHLCIALEQPQTKISRHLAMLKKGGLLQNRKEGKWVFYRLSSQASPWVMQIIESIWSNQYQLINSMINKLILVELPARSINFPLSNITR
ncbi:metalloregulator ArsR/SmtB family transcription factor [Arsenophonus sp. aPb]|uniref:metalloregulator ArsR/SmtB family transcription factor n=1 Tax=Arsenophonus sp. aPb TaxID=3041619 RepID=UPI0024686437|nr:metalloregulator ArsR/SmtB family transcription factor [Arsenophonus sp. aPb]WGL98308.1 metalloregulator ArsR/SmtB family transcription factor [Arsenophonus sp. aPb]